MSIKIVIPARYQSSRLPAKPLLDIAQRPMIWHTYQRALETGLSPESIYIATDHEAIAEVAHSFGAQVVMTSEDHASGTSRMLEVAEKMGWSDDTIIMNVQGDEPFVRPEEINLVIEGLQEQPKAMISTLACPLEIDDVTNENNVKVMTNAQGYAIYFSRATIPFVRSDQRSIALEHQLYHRHIGLYAYRLHALKVYHNCKPTLIEQVEQLEQLRAIYYGMPIYVAKLDQASSLGVDTEDDLERARAYASQMFTPQ